MAVSCAAPPTDATSYRQALVEAPTFEAAREACDHVQDPATRGDCQVTITERFERLSPGDCAHVQDPVWLDECRFLLAERIGKSGDLPLALTVCKQSRFRRYCAWHLLQDAVDATITAPASQAERVLEGFGGIPSLKDAPFQFWRIRWRELAGRGVAADATDCQGLTHQVGCEQALTRHVWEMLETVSRKDRARICALPRGERVLHRGVPSWLTGSLTTSAEAAWEAERCPRTGESR